jgi:hypothetical protein
LPTITLGGTSLKVNLATPNAVSAAIGLMATGTYTLVLTAGNSGSIAYDLFVDNDAFPPTGNRGATGPTGPTGAAGAAGAAGTRGATGAAGATGVTGAVGPTGVAGSVGATGGQGTAGPAGLRDRKVFRVSPGLRGVFGRRWRAGLDGCHRY